MDVRHLHTEKQRLAQKNLLFSAAIDALFANAPTGQVMTFVCDDEQDSAMEYYKLFNKYKQQHPALRPRLVGLCFFDDKFAAHLQAADMAAYVLREEARRVAERPNDPPSKLVAVLSEHSRTTTGSAPVGYYRL
jgi:hypothetical protein